MTAAAAAGVEAPERRPALGAMWLNGADAMVSRLAPVLASLHLLKIATKTIGICRAGEGKGDLPGIIVVPKRLH